MHTFMLLATILATLKQQAALFLWLARHFSYLEHQNVENPPTMEQGRLWGLPHPTPHRHASLRCVLKGILNKYISIQN